MHSSCPGTCSHRVTPSCSQACSVVTFVPTFYLCTVYHVYNTCILYYHFMYRCLFVIMSVCIYAYNIKWFSSTAWVLQLLCWKYSDLYMYVTYKTIYFVHVNKVQLCNCIHVPCVRRLVNVHVPHSLSQTI